MKKMLGVMLDCSRNAVMTVQTVKKYAQIIRKMGYNTLMLYTEDTYEMDNHPYFGHLRGRYTKEELKEIDAYCVSIGIELIPCIQTLAHLNAIFKWRGIYTDINDCDDILLCGDEKTYQLVEDMISTMAECFTSRKIHLGMDEAYRVGTGKYQQLHGIEDRFDIINTHLHKVCDISEKYGFEPMIWSDMFCKLALEVEDQYADIDNSKILEKAALPQNISLVYWDYYTKDYDKYIKRIEKNQMFGRKVYFAGCTWTWKGFTPDNSYSIDATKAAIKACNDRNVDGAFFTVWGDDTTECSYFTILPTLMYAAELTRGNSDIESIKKKFKEIVGCDYDDFMLFDAPDDVHGKELDNPSKYFFYNDPFMGIRDFFSTENDREYYKKLTEKIHNVATKGEYEYLFNTYEKLSDVLSIKCDLGVRTRKAYLENNKQALREIIKDYEVLDKKLREFHELHQARWFTENKPHGFDIQDIRIGGLLQRLESCKKRIEKFVLGELDTIPELEEPVLNTTNGFNHWSRIVTPNRVIFGTE